MREELPRWKWRPGEDWLEPTAGVIWRESPQNWPQDWTLASPLNWTNGQMMQFKEQTDSCRIVGLWSINSRCLEKGIEWHPYHRRLSDGDTADSRREWGPHRGPMLARWNQDFSLKGDKTEQPSEPSSCAWCPVNPIKCITTS